MLQDSFREAIDGWIFYVMLALIGLLVVLVASVSVTPLPPDRAMQHLIETQAFTIVSPNRGESKKLYILTSQPTISGISGGDANSPRPWENKISFVLALRSRGMGTEAVEVDDPKKPTKAKPVENTGGFFSNPLKEAARLWASSEDGKTKPKYSDDLGIEFLTYQLRSTVSLNVTSVKKLGDDKFEVSADGVTGKKAWPHSASLFFGGWNGLLEGHTLGHIVYYIEDILLNTFGAWVLMLAGVIVTSAFIPNLMRKGSIDLLITKPMSRPLILIYKYLGGLSFVLLLTALAVGGVWLVVGVRTGIWSPGLLYCIFGITFYFAILYACSTLFGVLTRNAIVCIVVTIVFWFVVWLIGYLYSTFTLVNNIQNMHSPPSATAKDGDEKASPSNNAEISTNDPEKIPEGVVKVFEVLNAVTPRTKDLDKLTTRLIGEGLLSAAEQKQAASAMHDVRWGEVLAVAGVWIAFFLGLALLRFVTRSY
jgi:ABC-type transport system involved in multi-copper enzyme maturation permease subunit